ncbi:MAG: hypothetical protein P8Y61_09820 [Gammaproteobacteria bacterium]|jgi:hypothetical protein
MSRIPMKHRGKRPRMFSTNGVDELMSMVLELTAELWVIKKRLYLLERVAGQAGVPLTPEIENYDLSEAEIAELDALRRTMIATVLRSIESDNTPGAKVREEVTQTGMHTDAVAA